MGRAQSHSSGDHHLTRYVIKAPRIVFTVLPIQEVSSKARHHDFSTRVLCPVGSEGIKVVPTEINHRIKLVHQPKTKPKLRVLRDAVAGIPVIRGITA